MFAPLILREALGLILFLTSFHQIVDRRRVSEERFIKEWPKYGYNILWTVSVLEIVLGLSLVAGINTQITALLIFLLSAFALTYRKYRIATRRDIQFYTLTLAIALSLVITGAGIFAYDFPL
jgi:uncharacterized membrane protein YphA (DoxX/SURF4 family)